MAFPAVIQVPTDLAQRVASGVCIAFAFVTAFRCKLPLCFGRHPELPFLRHSGLVHHGCKPFHKFMADFPSHVLHGIVVATIATAWIVAHDGFPKRLRHFGFAYPKGG